MTDANDAPPLHVVELQVENFKRLRALRLRTGWRYVGNLGGLRFPFDPWVGEEE